MFKREIEHLCLWQLKCAEDEDYVQITLQPASRNESQNQRRWSDSNDSSSDPDCLQVMSHEKKKEEMDNKVFIQTAGGAVTINPVTHSLSQEDKKAMKDLHIS